MKEYVAQTGGRYTYVDDVLNLQELAMSMTSIFEGCSNFIISGCVADAGKITPGYVWINGKVRRFEGCTTSQFPYYLYEANSYEATTYANDVNKRGRCNYLCLGAVSVPQQPDPVTGALPGFIEMREDHSPRFIDKFFGRYAVLLESPFSKQTVKKDLTLTGKFTAEKEIESRTGVSVVGPSGYVLRNIVKSSGDASLGAYHNGLLVSEIVIHTDGSFSLWNHGRELARIDAQGVTSGTSRCQTHQVGDLRIFGQQIINVGDNTDQGAVNVNRTGYEGGTTRFRNFRVFDGKSSVPMLSVEGADRMVGLDALLQVRSEGRGMQLANTLYAKTEVRLVNTLDWLDKNNEKIAGIGFDSATTFDFAVRNTLGNILLSPGGYVDILGELRVGGVNIAATYVAQSYFTAELAKKVNVVAGKQLSTEDFTTAYRNKLDAISTGDISGAEGGFATAGDVAGELRKKLNIENNLSEVADKAAARTNLDVFSKPEAKATFLKISNHLSEITSLSSFEVEGKTPEQIIGIKEQRQQAVRDNIDAERKGSAELRLAKASNLADLGDKVKARQNLSVYSVSEIDSMLSGKLGNDAAYSGLPFTLELKNKLDGIRTGHFAGIDAEGKSVAQAEGYVPTSAVVKELAKKANLLLDGLNSSQKESVCENLGIYSKAASDARYAAFDQLFQDYIAYLVKGGKTTSEAQKILRDKLDVPSKGDVSSTCVSKTAQLSDLSLPNANAKKVACQNLGAAYAEDVQTKLIDTGWIQMSNSGVNTDTKALFIRQIGNVVSIQGQVNTSKADGGHRGGIVAIIPNQIQPPRYGLRHTLCDFNEDHGYNRGASFFINGGSRNLTIYESGWPGTVTNLNFTYFV